MSQGIIATIDATGTGGSIMITETSVSSPAGTGMGSPAGSSLAYGSSIAFTESLGAGITLGDLVNFDLIEDPATGSSMAGNISKIADGALYSGTVGAAVTVAAGEAALIKDADISGKVSAGSGSTLLMSGNNIVRDKIEGKGAKLVLIIGGTTAKKKGEVKDVIKIKILNNKGTFEEKLKIKNCQNVEVDNNHIMGDLSVENCQEVIITNNIIDKDLEAEDTAQITITGNTIGGDLELENVASYTEENNTVFGEIKLNEED